LNLLNRIVLVLACLALAAGAISLVVLAWTIPQESIDGLRDAVDWLDEHNEDLEKALLTSGGALLAFIALVVLAFELVPRAGADVKVTDLRVGDAVLSTLSISQRIEEAVRQVPSVTEARAGVRAKRKGVLLSLDLRVEPEANLATVTDEACEAAQDVLMNRLHVTLVEQPRVRLHYRELRLRSRAPATAAPPAAPEAVEAPAGVAAKEAPAEAAAEEKAAE